jgi:hypothetical protein
VRIVVATHALSGFGGTETYVETVAGQLQRTGHDVVVWAPVQGRFGEALRERGLRVAATEGELGEAPDRVLANAADVAYDLAGRWPGVPQAYVCHAEVFDLQTPPQLPGVAGAVVVMHDRVGRWAASLAHRPEVVRLRQPVDLQRFAPRGAARERPRTLLMLGNYARGARRAMVEEACARAGLEPVTIGSLTAATERSEEAIARADVVMGKARAVVEAMACGRAAYVYDHNGGDGWVVPGAYARLEADNFGGQATDAAIDAGRLAADLAAWDPGMGLANRDLAVRHHSAITHCEGLVGVLERLDGAPAPPAGAREMARLVRVGWAAEAALMGARLDAERALARQAELEAEIDGLRARARRAEDVERAADALTAREAEVAERLRLAEERERATAAFRATRRYRLAVALARPLDRARPGGGRGGG